MGITEKANFEQNINDIRKFYKFLNHQTFSVFQVFQVGNEYETNKQSVPSRQIFIPQNDSDFLLKLCSQYKHSGIICLGINERPNKQREINDIFPKINVLLFDIDCKKKYKINGISPDNIKKEAWEVVKKCRIKLEELGFQINLLVDSGNGYHIYIKANLDVPAYTNKNEFEETHIYKKLLFLEKHLKKLDTKHITIDNISKDVVRRVKIAGTLNLKRYKDKSSGKFLIMPKEQWRLSKILYVSNNINEKQNTATFLKLPEIKTKHISVDVNLNKPFNKKKKDEMEKRFSLLLEENNELKQLYEGKYNDKYNSRSEAEMSLVSKLMFRGFSDIEVFHLMEDSKIGRWQEKKQSYKKLTLEKARQFYLTKQNEHDKKKEKKKVDIKTLFEEIEKLNPDDLNLSENIDIIIKKIGNNQIIKEQIFKKIKEKAKIGINSLQNRYRTIYENKEKKEKIIINEVNKGSVKYDNEYFIGEHPIKQNEIWAIKYDINKEGKTYIKDEKQILYGKLEILQKCLDVNIKQTRYNFKWNNMKYNAHTLNNMLETFENDLYKGTWGRNMISYYIRKLAEDIPLYKAEYTIGFRDGWKLPQIEEEKKIMLITPTDYNKRAYNNAKNMIKEYSNKEKDEIKKDLKRFIEITQIQEEKKWIMIGWTISAPFRNAFIEKYNIFPLKLLTGKHNTGKSLFEDFWDVHFYGVWEDHFSPSHAQSVSRVEDLLASTSFPVNIQEVHKINKSVIAIFKDQAGSRSRFERKKPNQKLEVSKPKTAPLSMDANETPEGLIDPALNTKMIHMQLFDEIKSDSEWIDLYLKLSKKKLFSFIYNYTKDWDRKKVFEIFKFLEEKKFFEEKYKSYTRLKPIFISIMFGLYIFSKVFGYEMTKEKKSSILNVLAQERRKGSKDFADSFYLFCNEAIDFDEGEDGRRGNNKPYINAKLEKYNKGYGFSPINQRDFVQFMGLHRMGMKTIAYNVKQSLHDKSLIRPQTITLPDDSALSGIYILDKFFSDYKKNKKKTKLIIL